MISYEKLIFFYRFHPQSTKDVLFIKLKTLKNQQIK